MRKRRLLLLTLICIAVQWLYLEPALAIPAFARKYRLSCSTCHVAVPKLKEYGEEFAANGFLLPEGQEPARAYVKTGDDLLTLQRDLPVAIRFDIFAQVADRETAKSDFQFPYGIKLLSGGPVSKHVSYYFYFFIDERGEVAGIEDAYLHFNNIGGSNLDIMVGQFQVSDPLFKRELRLTFEDYQMYRVKPLLSSANLTYDRGVIINYGFDFGLDVFAEVVNGNGIGEAHERLFDADNHKNFALRLSQSIGPLRIGGFGYTGKEDTRVQQVNEITMIGPDATLSLPKFEFNLQYLYRKDTVGYDRPLGQGPTQTEFKGGFLEALFLPRGDRSRWLFTALYNRIDSNVDLYDYETITLSASHVLARNLRLVFEATQDLINHKPRFTAGIVSAF